MRIECPSQQCNGRSSTRQHALSEPQLAKLSVSAQERVATAGGAMRCSYCGCVHVADGNGRRVALGSLDGGVTGAGWTSRRHP